MSENVIENISKLKMNETKTGEKTLKTFHMNWSDDLIAEIAEKQTVQQRFQDACHALGDIVAGINHFEIVIGLGQISDAVEMFWEEFGKTAKPFPQNMLFTIVKGRFEGETDAIRTILGALVSMKNVELLSGRFKLKYIDGKVKGFKRSKGLYTLADRIKWGTGVNDWEESFKLYPLDNTIEFVGLR